MAGKGRVSGLTPERTATLVALIGFLPFALFTSLLLADPGLISIGDESERGRIGSGIVTALKLYAAIVLSFIGGIRWGIAIARSVGGERENEALILAAGPALLGWFAFYLGEPWSFALLAVAFAATGWWDSRLSANDGVPEWFARLRILLTALVMITMVAAFAATL